MTSLKYQRGMGDFLVSCSYDTTAAIWACPGFLPVKTLPHQGIYSKAHLKYSLNTNLRIRYALNQDIE